MAESKAKKFWQGKKTHTANWVNAAAVVATTAGVAVDPEVVMAFISGFWEWIIAGELGLAALVSWFRQLGKKTDGGAS